MNYNFNEPYQSYLFKRDLRKTSNSLGLFLLFSFAIEYFISSLLIIFLELTSNSYESLGSLFQSLMNAAIYSITFVLPGILYCIIKRVDFNKCFPFKKIKFSLLFMLVVIGLTLSLVSNYASDMLTNVLKGIGIDNSIDTQISASNAKEILLNYISIALLPAFMEEFVFRGIILGLFRKFSDTFAILASALLFGLMHSNFVQIPFAFCGGLIFGYLAVATNSLLPSMIVHFLNNAISVTIQILEQNEILSENILNIVVNGTFIILCILSLIFIYRIFKSHKELVKIKDETGVISFKEKISVFCKSPAIIVFACFCILSALIALFLL